MEDWYNYERLGADGKIEHAPYHDPEGKIMGLPIIGVKAWMDEHPDETHAMGWKKHIHPPTENLEYDRQTQYILTTAKAVDEWTLIDEFIAMDKTEDQMLLEEMGVSFEIGFHSGNIILM